MLTRGLDMKHIKQTPSGLQVPGDTSLVPCTTSCAQADVPVLTGTKPARQPRRENTRDGRERMSLHSVFVLGSDGKPLTPTTPAKARKLLEGGQAKKAWSKFGTFGIQMLVDTRTETPLTVLGYDIGTKYEGIVVVSGVENVLAVKLDLPDKKNIVRKMEERRNLRHTRRQRKYRRRSNRLNRSRKAYLSPSQSVIVASRLKVLSACFSLFPISVVGDEEPHFNYTDTKFGSNFSTMEIGKSKIRHFFENAGAMEISFRGFETEALREKYGYKKTKSKSKDKFTTHCSDALSLACEVGAGIRVVPGQLLVIDDTYRPVRRKLNDINFSKGGIRESYSCGSVFGLRKGLLIGTDRGKIGQLCGESNGKYRYYDIFKKRQVAVQLTWISNQFLMRGVTKPSYEKVYKD